MREVYVAVPGNNAAGDGSAQKPYANIVGALAQRGASSSSRTQHLPARATATS